MEAKNRHESVYEGITTMLCNGELSKNEKLPSERQLVERFRVSRPVISRVITRLVAEGVLYKKEGRRGTFINADNDHQVERPGSSGTLLQQVIKHVVASGDGPSPVKHGVMEGVYSVASKRKIQTVLEYVSGKDEWSEKVLGGDTRTVAGLIIWGHSFNLGPDEIKELNDSKIPYVIVDSMPDSGNFSFVGSDNTHGAEMMVKHLASLGHKRICYVTENDLHGSMKQRLCGFMQAMVSNNLELTGDSILKIDESDEKSFFVSIAKLVKKADGPTAIFASHDRLILRVFDFLNDLGLRCPDDISVAGYDNIDISPYMQVPLTTIKQDFFAMGKHAAELILDEANIRYKNQKIQILLEPELVVRKSTGKIASGK